MSRISLAQLDVEPSERRDHRTLVLPQDHGGRGGLEDRRSLDLEPRPHVLEIVDRHLHPPSDVGTPALRLRIAASAGRLLRGQPRSEEHTSELQSLTNL